MAARRRVAIRLHPELVRGAVRGMFVKRLASDGTASADGLPKASLLDRI